MRLLRSRRLAGWVRLAFAALLTLGATSPAGAADVFLNSGNFRADHYDMVMPLWLGSMTVSRVYNSSTYKGMFGIGWETTLETNLEVQDDGSVLAREYGGGAANQFAPTNKATRPVDAIESELASVATQSGRVGSDAQMDSYEDWLEKNHAAEWSRFRNLGMIVPQQSHAGEIFSSARFGESQFIIRVPEGYQRVTPGGKIFEAFDLSGRLQRVWDVNRNFITLRYTRGQLAEISDNFGNRYAFTFNKRGLVESIAGPGGRTARFSYNGDYLVKSTDATKATYSYTYDAQQRMTGIGYPDGKWKRIGYYSMVADKMTSELVVKQVSNPDGSVTTYKYTSPDATHSNTEFITTDAAGKKSDYVYQYQSRNGLWDLTTILLEGKVTEEGTYDATGRLITYTKSSVKSSYRYNAYGQMIGATDPTASTTWEYDEATGRIAVATIAGTGAKSWHYTYDSHGNLVHATDSAGNDVTLAYDRSGRRTSATLGAQVVHFAYDQYFEPTKAWADGLGEAEITYNEIGEIKSVTGPGGAKVDTKLTTLTATIQGVLVQANEDLLPNYAGLAKAVAK